MKRTLLTILPVAAALLLATSCSKDTDDNIIVNNPTPAETQKDVSPAEPKTVPFSIDVVPGGSLSKIAYNDDGTTVTVKFDNDDITAGLTMSVTDGTHSTTLNLTAVDAYGKGTFTGSWSEGDEPSDGAEITATVAYKSSSTVVNSTESVQKLMASCAHTYKGTFNYQPSGGNSVTLTDDRAYIEFTLAEGQKKVSVNGQWYDVDQTSHKAYVAVEGNTEVTTRIKGKKTLKAGKIYTIECTDVVDLGLSVLWCTSNANSPETDQKSWEEAKTLANSNEGYDLPSADNFRELIGKKSVEGVTVTTGWKSGEGAAAGLTFSTDYGSVFFPAAGYFGGVMAGEDGSYWSRESPEDGHAYYLSIIVVDVSVNPVNQTYSVRLVRGL